MSTETEPTTASRIVTSAEWLAARLALLEKEKDLTRRRDALAAERRTLPWTRVTKSYVFHGPEGAVPFSDLFAGRSQLMIYHFMFGPGWDEGCKSCSFVSDHFDPMLVHLAARDVSLAVVSHAPWAEIAPFRQRMGWKFRWVSSHGTGFNQDYHVSFDPREVAADRVYYNYTMQSFPMEEAPGLSVFARNDDGEIFHTYSTYGRGLDGLMNTYNFLDLVPKGRDEGGLERPMQWVRYHDRYEEAGVSA